ncbi:AMP-binding protein [Plantactinospora sp. KLBMP9567]|uniref:AMP-binding protein n=1 Tax=Plantactinospora sp. KLBMP9567 TaxID=3085900 RepID=UPI0029818A5D|nr:AMP-binding protein [Plantactinospora sp. KLBMP9567]MDW5322252.1 AMP-binding protein [Plantactinospora sp. KLBMP9567]
MTRLEGAEMSAQTRTEGTRYGDSGAPRVVPDLLRRSARLVPERPAVVVDGRPVLTFAEIEARSNALARGVRDRGVVRGDKLALVFAGPDWPEFVVAYFGALKVGAAALLLGERFTGEDIRRLVARHRVAGIVTAPGTVGAPGPVGSGRRPSGPAEPGQGTPGAGGTGPDGAGAAVAGVGCWAADTADLTAGQDDSGVPIEATPLDIADVVFTSGTTALPRGVVATHANVVRAQPTWPTGVRANQPGLHALPLGSVAGQIHLVNSIGGQQTLVIMPEFTVPDFRRLTEQWQVSSVFLVPAMGHWLVRARTSQAPKLSTVRGVHFSGAALPVGIMPELPAVFPNATFYNFYSSTEAFPARVATQFDPDRPDSVGRPVGANQVRITAEDGSLLGAGAVGVVWLRSAVAPSRRFLDGDGSDGPGPGATGTAGTGGSGTAAAGAAGFQDGWTRTGDLGYLDADGYLFLAGRTDDVVNVGGFNVSTYRVEEVLGRHEAVAEAAVFPVDHPVLGEVIAAFVVLRAEASTREIRQHAARQLSRRELPAIIRLVEEIPRNAAGKVPKRHLPELLDGTGPASFTAPRTEVEERMAQAWAELLDVGSVGVHDNFFEIGGDSLLAVEVAAQLRVRLGVELDAVTIFELATVAELARYVAEDRAGDPGEEPDEHPVH